MVVRRRTKCYHNKNAASKILILTHHSNKYSIFLCGRNFFEYEKLPMGANFFPASKQENFL